MKFSVLSTSRKEHELRRPIHPAHFDSIPAEIRQQLFFEKGYGVPFGVSDDAIASLFAGVAERDQLLRDSDFVVLAKPVAADAEAMKPGATLWGWVHCVQGREITQAAIDRKLTFITWEMMNHWNDDGSFRSHIFHANNQIAGYAAVLHAATLRGIDGHFGSPRRVVLINTGQVSRGAVRGLRSLGFSDITVVTPQELSLVPSDFEGCSLYSLDASDPKALVARSAAGFPLPLIELLETADVIVNGIFQNPLNPYHFVQKGEEPRLKENALIIDVSCDAGMGFPFARATSFDGPVVKVGQYDYYAVDHTPSFLWDSATWQILTALLPYLQGAMEGPTGWEREPVLEKAIEIQDGQILNPDILTFQKRSRVYPHPIEA